MELSQSSEIDIESNNLSGNGNAEINAIVPNNYIVYLLVNTDTTNPCTYVGSTNNPARRIRQHNGELVGGAKYTKHNKRTGKWRFYGYIQHLEKRQALSIEKRIQIRSRKMTGKRAIDRRIKAFNGILEDYIDLGLCFTYSENGELPT
jgi:predicted GIY-YIG superfamily endonuclease